MEATSIDSVSTWLKNPYDYNRGVELLRQAQQASSCVNRALIFMLETGESQFNKKKLIEALSTLEQTSYYPLPQYSKAAKWINVPQQIPTFHQQEKSRKSEQEFRKSEQIPQPSPNPTLVNGWEKTSFDQKLVGYYQLQSDRHSKLKLLHQLGHSQKELQAVCFEILDIGRKIRAIQLLQDEWKRTDEMPDAIKTVHDLDPASQVKRRNNNRSYITKFDGVESKQDEVDRRIQENYELDEILK